MAKVCRLGKYAQPTLKKLLKNTVHHLHKQKRDISVSFLIWAGVDSNHRTLTGTDLQSVAFSHSATYPYLIVISSPFVKNCLRRDLNS